MGERGIERPEWKPRGTKYTFRWPMGVPRGERDYLTRVARAKTNSSLAAVLWLGKFAWRHLHRVQR